MTIMVILPQIGDSFRKHQKVKVLGAGLGIILLYITPIDQIVNALPSKIYASFLYKLL